MSSPVRGGASTPWPSSRSYGATRTSIPPRTKAARSEPHSRQSVSSQGANTRRQDRRPDPAPSYDAQALVPRFVTAPCRRWTAGLSWRVHGSDLERATLSLRHRAPSPRGTLAHRAKLAIQRRLGQFVTTTRHSKVSSGELVRTLVLPAAAGRDVLEQSRASDGAPFEC
jgi:hypothetical protein